MEMDEAEHFEESSKKRSSKENKSYEFDDLLRLTGGFGRYQMALYVFICLVSIPTGAQLLVQVFYGASPRFNCIAVSGNQTCDPGKCCSNCQKYEFQGPFTSAVSEVCVVYAVRLNFRNFLYGMNKVDYANILKATITRVNSAITNKSRWHTLPIFRAMRPSSLCSASKFLSNI